MRAFRHLAPAVVLFSSLGTFGMSDVHAIAPYKDMGLWVFDDPRVGLEREPFVSGADTMIDRAVAGIPGAEHGFILLFSRTPFPASQLRLQWRRSEGGGDWYYSPELGMEGWLCPALLRYFPHPPRQIFVQVKPKAA